MKQLYLEIEKVYCDPNVRQGKIPNGGTAQEIDWECLGTEERMAQYAKLMESAHSLAVTEREKRNVELFDRGIWKYMVCGKGRSQLGKWWSKPTRSSQLMIPCVPAAANGDPLLADLSKAVKIDGWLTETGQPSPRQLEASLAHDGRNLYIELRDNSAQSSPKDAWEMVFALRRELPLGRLKISADGKCQGIAAVAKPAGSAMRVAIPLTDLAGGVEPGWHFFGNLERVAADGAHAAWLPTMIGFEPTDWLGRLTLSIGEGMAPPPAPKTATPALPQ